MAGRTRALPWVAASAAVVLVTACDNGPSAVAPQAAGSQMAYAADSRRGPAAPGDRVDHRRDPVRKLDGKPLWAASRSRSAEESARKAFDRNGAAFGARNLDDYARKARAFVERPPEGVETLTRANGDTLFYDAQANVFAVADKTGAPRTMFKPDDGAAYWQEQKAREQKRSARSERRRDGGADAAA